MVTQQLSTYSQVLGAARGLEQVMEKESRSRLQTRPLKRSFDQVVKGPPARISSAPPNRHSFTTSPPLTVCDFCQRPGHLRRNCRWANDQCLACGSRDHQLANCPSKRQRSIMPALLTLEAIKRNPVLAGRGAPLPSQRQVFKQA